MSNFSVGRKCLVGHDDVVGKICRINVHVNHSSINIASRQVLRDISCVNPSRTPKAFKGKGSAVSQCVKSGSIASSSVLAGAGA